MPADDPVRKLALAALDADAMARELLAPGDAVPRLSFSDLYRYASDPGFELPNDAHRRLQNDPAAAADLERLIAAQPYAHMPRQAAAATTDTIRRETDFARMTLTPSRATPTQVYIVIDLTDTQRPAPRQLFVRCDDGWLRRALPQFSGSRAQVLLEADSDLARALADPETEVYLR